MKIADIETESNWYRLINDGMAEHGAIYLAVSVKGLMEVRRWSGMARWEAPPLPIAVYQPPPSLVGAVLGTELRIVDDMADDEIEARPR